MKGAAAEGGGGERGEEVPPVPKKMGFARTSRDAESGGGIGGAGAIRVTTEMEMYDIEGGDEPHLSPPERHLRL